MIFFRKKLKKPAFGWAVLATILFAATAAPAQSPLDVALSEEPVWAGTLAEDDVLYLESNADAWHEWAPDSLTFEVLNSSCTLGVNFEFYLNGTLLGVIAAGCELTQGLELSAGRTRQ